MAVIATQCAAILLDITLKAAGGCSLTLSMESDMFCSPLRSHFLLHDLKAVLLVCGLAFFSNTASAQDVRPLPVIEAPDTSGIAPQLVEEQPEPVAPLPGKRQRVAIAKVLPRVDQSSGKTHFVEFRARSALSYGHTFAAFGRLNSRGQIETFEVAGLHPAGESSVPWSIGHVIAVPSETGPSDGDLEEQYVTARFRINLTEAEYRKLLVHIRKLQNNSPMWHAVLYNCSAFVADIGKFMGLQAPHPLLYPADFINSMREMNVSRVAGRMPEEQRPDR